MADAQPPIPPQPQYPPQPAFPPSYQTGSAPPAMPSGAGYLIGGLVVLAGIIVGGILLVNGFATLGHALSFPRSVQPDGSIEITRSGPYIVYEVQTVVGDYAQPTRSASATVSGPDGSVRYTGEYQSTRTQTRGFEKAVAVATFRADVAGTYHVTATNLPPGHSLGIGDGRPVETRSIGLGFMLGGLGMLIGLIIIIVTAVRRHNAKPKPMFVPYGYAPGMGPPPGWGPQSGMGPPPGWGPPPLPGTPPAAPATPPSHPGTPSASDQEWWRHPGPPSPPTA